MKPLAAPLAYALNRFGRGWGRGVRGTRAVLGWTRPPRIVPYRGWSSGVHALVLARVIEDRGAPEWREGASLRHTFSASYKRYATLELPDVEVHARWSDGRWIGTTDEEGHLALEITTPSDVRPGWNEVELSLPDRTVSAICDVLRIDRRAEFAVISDIDDTVIDTNVRHPLARAATLFLTDSRVRLPFPGVAALYRALHAERNPIFYVSSSPWNLYEHLIELFARHDVPKGPLLLRDWGLSRHGFAPLGGHGHKREKLARVLADVAPLPAVLIGDSGQEDARHYVAIAEQHRGRVAMIYIRDVGYQRAAEIAALKQRARACGTELVVVENSDAAALHAAAAGLIRREEVTDVAVERRVDEAAPGPIEQVLHATETIHEE